MDELSDAADRMSQCVIDTVLGTVMQRHVFSSSPVGLSKLNHLKQLWQQNLLKEHGHVEVEAPRPLPLAIVPAVKDSRLTDFVMPIRHVHGCVGRPLKRMLPLAAPERHGSVELKAKRTTMRHKQIERKAQLQQQQPAEPFDGAIIPAEVEPVTAREDGESAARQDLILGMKVLVVVSGEQRTDQSAIGGDMNVQVPGRVVQIRARQRKAGSAASRSARSYSIRIRLQGGGGEVEAVWPSPHVMIADVVETGDQQGGTDRSAPFGNSEAAAALAKLEAAVASVTQPIATPFVFSAVAPTSTNDHNIASSSWLDSADLAGLEDELLELRGARRDPEDRDLDSLLDDLFADSDVARLVAGEQISRTTITATAAAYEETDTKPIFGAEGLVSAVESSLEHTSAATTGSDQYELLATGEQVTAAQLQDADRYLQSLVKRRPRFQLEPSQPTKRQVTELMRRDAALSAVDDPLAVQTPPDFTIVCRLRKLSRSPTEISLKLFDLYLRERVVSADGRVTLRDYTLPVLKLRLDVSELFVVSLSQRAPI